MSRRSLTSLLLLLPLLAAAHCPPTPVHLTSGYALIFLDNTSSSNGTVKARYSSDGLTWQDGNFPSAVQPISAGYAGVGGGTDSNGVLDLAVLAGSNNVQLRWGLGPAVWDNSAVGSSVPPPASAPSVAGAENNIWFVAYRRGDGTVAVLRYNLSTKQFEADVTPFHALNSSVTGTPDIAFHAGNLVLAWRRNGAEIVVATATVQQGTPSWTVTSLPLPATADFHGGAVADPAVAQAGNISYVAVVREETGQPLHGFQTEVLRSVGGGSWSTHSRGYFLTVVRESRLSLAARSTGRLLIAAIRDTGIASAAMYDPQAGHWVDHTAAQVNAMFGGDNHAVDRPFTVFTTGPR